MRALVIVLSLVVPIGAWATAAVAKERAAFLDGQYATAAQCEKLRKIEAGGKETVSTAPELLDADGFRGWEGGCEFTKLFEHEPGQSWLAFMVCSEGMSVNAATYVFVKDGDAFEVHRSGEEQGPELYTRCDAKKGK
ncbi:MAG TPA: hypothetical protein PK857_03055 [Hyphomicrobium sp.]|nr:hypothetical protein [Hyphomicrobium sp.]HRO51192.1 hypothetical protein [Hyphomicrobium sp.]